MKGKEMKINIGCGGRPLENYINVDMDSLKKLQKRYPTASFPKNIQIYDWDIFKLPVDNESVAEILCEGMIEHLSFEEEPKFFYEIK